MAQVSARSAGGAGIVEPAPAIRRRPGLTAKAPLISVVIPCHNGADTVGRSLASLRRQSLKSWEAVVVDDGSTDRSSDVVQAWCDRDPRIRLLRQENGGVARARNRGLELAAGEWLLFLDCDDWLGPKALERLHAAAQARPDCGVVVGRAAKVLPDGRRQSYPACDLSDAFGLLCCEGRIAIHSALVRREIVDQAGGFDPGLRTSEDWDLWQRIARAGVRFASIDSELAFYVCRPGSLSRRVDQVAADGLVVMRRGHAPDPRVAAAAPAYANGGPADALPVRELSFLFWCAARDLAQGGDGLGILRRSSGLGQIDLEPEGLGDLIASGMADMLSCEPRQLGAAWGELGPRLEAVLDEAFPGEAGARTRRIVLGVVRAKLDGAGADEVRLCDPDPLGSQQGRTPPEVLGLRGPAGPLGAVAVPALGPMSAAALARTLSAQARRLPLAPAVRALAPWRSGRFWTALGRGALEARRRLGPGSPGTLKRAAKVHLKRLVRQALEQQIAGRLRPSEPTGDCPHSARLDELAAAARRKAAHLPALGAPRTAGWSDRRAPEGRQDALSAPVLMYHQIASDGPAGLRRYRVTPELFAEQMAELDRRGFRTVTPEQLAVAFATGEPLPARPVMLTFDDGYVDFAEQAWPVLRRMGLSATLFVVPGKAGGAADWDADQGTPARLLDWPQIAALAGEGVCIESHSMVHGRLTRLGIEAVYADALDSAAAIERVVGRRPIAFCYPFGARDPAVDRIVEECGYRLGFTTSPGVAALDQDAMRLPRIEVSGFDTLETFAAKLEAAF